MFICLGALGCLCAQTSRAQRKRWRRSFAIGHPKRRVSVREGKAGYRRPWLLCSQEQREEEEVGRGPVAAVETISQVSTYRLVKTAKEHVSLPHRGTALASVSEAGELNFCTLSALLGVL